jgi:hypothetical protein
MDVRLAQMAQPAPKSRVDSGKMVEPLLHVNQIVPLALQQTPVTPVP